MYVVRKEVTDVEKLLEVAGIEVYAKYICGFHIHGRAATSIDDSICLLEYAYIRDYFSINYEASELKE